MTRFIPNALTTLRFVLIPVLLWTLVRCDRAADAGLLVDRTRLVSLLVLVGIGLSDVLDGNLARRWNLVSRTGALMDAIADKSAQFSALLYFTVFAGAAFTSFPSWLLLAVVLRDIVLGSGLLMLERVEADPPVEHDVHGKLATVLIFVLIAWTIAGFDPRGVLIGSVTVVAVVTYSTSLYVRAGWRSYRALGSS
ncbi:MAG: CDP-alcohol phosphatidyltransferase family protein [Gemmatimonadota bacterium]|nr:CDP-alcohol phosphatidyltransferase family protein [Gemmatimonadota bacterium]MDH5759036.1 CDP-alcohol phosphatidyltransferase family protein [Gemmatimonadota bacterium]